jgi:(E)-4-hydroxy-3-methylbut-2-enyl-diphosphate synthase
VKIGHLTIGDLNPIRVQSMTNTDTENIQATVDQILALEQVGCEIARVTAPSLRSAEVLEDIVNKLRQQNSIIPVVADIHFTPNAAMKAVEFVEKVRVNPGNYIDKKKFAVLEYTDEAYASELNRIEDKFTPLVLKAKQYGRAMRIGTNHGSLSDRIMNRYGDSPLGMVESAWEFAAICMKNDYHNFVFSMKASNTQVMIQAYRLLQSRMYQEDAIYPLHLGVTEAGDGEDGRVKSFIGIGSLLEDGLGDTIRVSLTESPLKEIPVALQLANHYNQKLATKSSLVLDEIRDPYTYQRRETVEVNAFGGQQPVAVALANNTALSRLQETDLMDFRVSDFATGVKADQHVVTIGSEADIDCLKAVLNKGQLITETLIVRLTNPSLAKFLPPTVQSILLPLELTNRSVLRTQAQCIYEFNVAGKTVDELAEALAGFQPEKNDAITLRDGSVQMYRFLACRFLNNPIWISSDHMADNTDQHVLDFSILAGALLSDGIGDGLLLNSALPALHKIQTAFTILQGTRLRVTKTEYISCPSCGRTLFDLEETTAEIKSHTSHLTGVKIAVMGCIVNGPGEMADADFGYVGSGVGKINLYVGKEVVKKNIQSERAVTELVELIKSHGMWKEANV